MVKVLAELWRDDGVINFIVPPVIAANTFLVLAPAHSSWLCFLMEDLSAALEPSDVPEAVQEQFHVGLEDMREGMAKSHKVAGEHQSRVKRGTEDMFPGMIYGTMHPAELSALADDLAAIIPVFALGDSSEAGKEMMQAWGIWIEGAKKYVRAYEAVAPVVQRTVKE